MKMNSIGNIKHNFKSHKVSDVKKSEMSNINSSFLTTALDVFKICPMGNEKDECLMLLDKARMLANAAIAREMRNDQFQKKSHKKSYNKIDSK